MNILGKYLLASTAMSPILVAIAINQISCDEPPTSWICWLAAAFILPVLCWRLLAHLSKRAQDHTFTIVSFDRRDHELLAFLLAYILPFVSSDNMLFTDQWLPGLYILLVIAFAIVHADALHFNPVMALIFGYHFYAVTDRAGTSRVLLSRTHIARVDTDVNTVKISHGVFLNLETIDAP